MSTKRGFHQFSANLDMLNYHITHSSIHVIRQKLYDFNFNSEYKIPSEKHPLITAIKLRSLPIVNEILKYIHDVNVVPMVLHTAVLYSTISIVDLLIQNGVTVNTTNANGDTALHITCASQNFKMTKRLITKNADVHAENVNTKLRPIHLLIKWSLFNFFINQSNIDLNTDDRYKQLLHFECKKDRHSIIQGLLTKYNVNIEHTNDERQTPIYLVCSTKVAKMFIARGAKINIMDKYKRTPIHEHCRTGSFHIASELILNNLDIRQSFINNADRFGKTALHYTFAVAKEMEMVTFFLENGAKLEYDHPMVRNYFNRELTWEYFKSAKEVSIYGRMLILELIIQNPKYIPDILLMEDYTQFEPSRKLIEQLKLLQESTIVNTNLSYFTVFTSTIERLSRYMNNSNIRNIPDVNLFLHITCSGWSIQFLEKYRLAKVRYDIKNIARENWLSRKFNVKQQMPILVIDEILSYLTNSDLNSFNRTFENN